MWAYIKNYLPPGPYNPAGVGLALLPVLVALVLLVIDYFGLQGAFVRRYGPALAEQGWQINDIRFLAQVYFSGFCVLLFVIVPLLFHLVLPPGLENPFGFRLRSCRPHIPLYALLIAIMLPILWLASAQPSFHDFYPMYKPVSLGMWLLYEAVYMTQFFCVEFFFRGVTLFRLESRFGFHAVTMMVVPYALLHIHKPFPEAVASIVAGLVLGMLALKSRSIWPGVAIHICVAFSMDLFALIRSGRLSALLQ